MRERIDKAGKHGCAAPCFAWQGAVLYARRSAIVLAQESWPDAGRIVWPRYVFLPELAAPALGMHHTLLNTTGFAGPERARARTSAPTSCP